MQLKRLWDTTTKQMVFAKWPTGHDCQVWTDEEGSKLYIYDKSQWLEYTPWVSNEGKTYWPQWKAIDGDDEVGFYDTNEPTELYTWESGDEATYIFKDYDGTVLKTGKVDEWETPTPPADPTREATAQYTYTFAWWNPTVWPITKKTTYTATYTSTVNQYTITFVDDDWTTTLDEQTLDYGATPVYAWETPTKEATAQYTYTFSGWTPTIATVTWNATYTATYASTVNTYTVSISSNDTDYWTVDESSLTVEYGTAISASNNVLTIWNTEITATAETGYEFSGWTDWEWQSLPATVTGALSVKAVFEASTPVYEFTNTMYVKYMEENDDTYLRFYLFADDDTWSNYVLINAYSDQSVECTPTWVFADSKYIAWGTYWQKNWWDVVFWPNDFNENDTVQMMYAIADDYMSGEWLTEATFNFDASLWTQNTLPWLYDATTDTQVRSRINNITTAVQGLDDTPIIAASGSETPVE